MQLNFFRRDAARTSKQKIRREQCRRRLSFDSLEPREMLSAGPVNPSGPQFMVNTTTQGTQMQYPVFGDACAPTVAMDSSGNTVAVWQSQQLNSSGQPTGYYTLMFQLYTKTFDNSIGN